MSRNVEPPHRLALVAVIVAGAAAFGSDSYAGTQTGNFPVTASVSANCTISTTAVAFGAYDPIVANLTSPKDAAGTVITTCTSGSSPTITLGEGSNPGAGSSAAAPVRQMASGSDRLGYELYTDATRTTVWSSTGVVAPAADGSAQTTTVYGRIPGGQNKPAGSYTDTVVATVTF